MAIFAKTGQLQKAGANHSCEIFRDLNSERLGVGVWDPARQQFAFFPDDQGLVLSTADATSIVSILNGLSR